MIALALRALVDAVPMFVMLALALIAWAWGLT
jgi:hypothetical protein